LQVLYQYLILLIHNISELIKGGAGDLNKVQRISKKSFQPSVFSVLTIIALGLGLFRAILLSSNNLIMRDSIDNLIKGSNIQYATVVNHYINGIGIENNPYPITVDFIGVSVCKDCPGWNDNLRKAAIETVNKLTKGKTVRIEFDVEKTGPQVGNWPNILGYVWVDKLLINAEMIRLGYLKADNFGENIKYREILLKAERIAREAHYGIWGIPQY
jgi:endonuclease YncB( thermonuclease family)